MFIPFLAAATVAAAFAQLGAMTVKISVLTKALQALSIAEIRSRHSSHGTAQPATANSIAIRPQALTREHHQQSPP